MRHALLLCLLAPTGCSSPARPATTTTTAPTAAPESTGDTATGDTSSDGIEGVADTGVGSVGIITSTTIPVDQLVGDWTGNVLADDVVITADFAFRADATVTLVFADTP